MKNQNAITNYPPYQSKCPDYWTVNSNGTCTQPSSNVNNLPSSYNPSRDTKIKSTDVSGPTTGPRIFDFTKYSVCDKKAWAKQWNIEWDGVSNSLAKC